MSQIFCGKLYRPGGLSRSLASRLDHQNPS
jgi:hypothetical protein